MEQERKVLNLSGAATKIAGLAGVTDYLHNIKGFRPTDITGISSGALLALPIALRKWDSIRELTQTFTLDDIFDIKPIDESNKVTLRAKLRVMLGGSSLGTQNNLYKTLQKIITREDFNRYQNGDFPNVWVGSVDFKTGGRHIVNIKNKNITYEEYQLLVNASASIPLAVESVKYKDMILYDGATRNHILSCWALENIPNITETISVFARPEDYSSVLEDGWVDKNVLTVFERYADINIIEISKRDEKEERLLIKTMDRDIKSRQIFIPTIIKEMYDTNPVKLRKLYNVGFKVASSQMTGW